MKFYILILIFILTCSLKGDPLCGYNEAYTKCSSMCEPTCDEQAPKCSKKCGPPKCQCAQGFFRDYNSKSCTHAMFCTYKPFECKGKNEVFTGCYRNCDPSCSDKTPPCTMDCGGPKCICKEGFVKDSKGSCIDVKKC
uniref:TIL domain-containing protein n=1 Tax=Parastrongyloides trichosuri TaxID=131310 RepID=A0A0N4Z5T0_PARTI